VVVFRRCVRSHFAPLNFATYLLTTPTPPCLLPSTNKAAPESFIAFLSLLSPSHQPSAGSRVPPSPTSRPFARLLTRQDPEHAISRIYLSSAIKGFPHLICSSSAHAIHYILIFDCDSSTSSLAIPTPAIIDTHPPAPAALRRSLSFHCPCSCTRAVALNRTTVSN
jgi:hypothetical protein